MKFTLTKGEQSVILTVFILDSSSTTGLGLGSLDQSSSIVGGYLKRSGTGVALAVDQNVTTEGTYEAPTTAAQVRIGTPANMRTGTYELHFHNDLFTTADWLSITLGGATNMAPLNLEIQLTTTNPNNADFGLALDNSNLAHVDANERIDVGSWLGTIPAALVGGRMDSNASAIDGSAPAAVNLKQSCLAIQVITVQTAFGDANTNTIFDTNLPTENADYYGDANGGLVVAFVGGAAQQYQTRRVTASVTAGSNTRITLESALDGVPTDADVMIVLGRLEI